VTDFAERLDALRPRLRNTLRRHGCRDYFLDDAVQQGVMQAWRRRGTFRGEAALATWATRVTLNEFFMMARGSKMSRNTRNMNEADELRAASEPDPAPSPLDLAVAGEARRRLVRAIARLPLGQRSILARQLLVDETYKELAASFGTTESNMKSQAFKGRAKVRRMLEARA
jgi:RNA polymerase sigma-70 factor (ECF subfamily)